MFEELLDFICQKKVYVDISGLTPTGVKIFLQKEDTFYRQGKHIVFTAEMVKEISFTGSGCKIFFKN